MHFISYLLYNYTYIEQIFKRQKQNYQGLREKQIPQRDRNPRLFAEDAEFNLSNF